MKNCTCHPVLTLQSWETCAGDRVGYAYTILDEAYQSRSSTAASSPHSVCQGFYAAFPLHSPGSAKGSIFSAPAFLRGWGEHRNNSSDYLLLLLQSREILSSPVYTALGHSGVTQGAGHFLLQQSVPSLNLHTAASLPGSVGFFFFTDF